MTTPNHLRDSSLRRATTASSKIKRYKFIQKNYNQQSYEVINNKHTYIRRHVQSVDRACWHNVFPSLLKFEYISFGRRQIFTLPQTLSCTLRNVSVTPTLTSKTKRRQSSQFVAHCSASPMRFCFTQVSISADKKCHKFTPTVAQRKHTPLHCTQQQRIKNADAAS